MKRINQKNLHDEIVMMRNVLQQVMEMMGEDSSLTELLRILDAIGKASTRLATLLKTDRALGSGENIHELLTQALHEMANDKGGKQS